VVLGERLFCGRRHAGPAVYFLDMFKILGDEPVLKAYVERCVARPAAQRAFSEQG